MRSTTSRLTGTPLLPYALALAAALAARLAVVSAAGDVLVLDERLYVDLARGMAAGERVLDPWFAPLYPAFLAAIFDTFGPGLLAPRLAHAVLGVVTVALTYALAARVHGRGAGLIAATTVALLPEMAGYAALFYTEHLFLPLFLGFLLALVAAMEAPERTMRFAAAGSFLGLATLTREAALAVAPVAAAFAALPAKGAGGRARRAIALLLPFAIVTGAWMGVNAARHGAFTLTANRWKPILEGNGTPRDLEEFRNVFDRDRFAAESFARERSLQRISEAQPLWIVTKSAAAFEGLFGPNSFLYRQARLATGERRAGASLAALATPLLALVLVTGALGFAAAPADRRMACLAATMAALFAIHVLGDAVTRHRLPFLPILAVGAAYFLDRLARDHGALRTLARPAPFAFATGAVALLALAWCSFILELR